MTYIELINEFWKQDRNKSFENVDSKFYLLMLDECNIRNWLNPFELHTYYLEGRLQIKRKAIGEARNRLKQRGVIDFIARPNNATIYMICNKEVTNSELFQMFLSGNNNETIGKQLGNNRETIGKQLYKDCKDVKTLEKEKPPTEVKRKTRTLSPAEQISAYRKTTSNEGYANFLNWLEEKAPYVAAHIQPLSEEEFEKLKQAYGSQAISTNVLAIENRKDLRKKYVSLYRTLLNWCKNGYNE